MLNNFDHDNLEHFLKQSADQCRMQPSARVWNGISKKLNTKRRWFGFGLSALLLCSFSLFYLSANMHKPSFIKQTPANHTALTVPTDNHANIATTLQQTNKQTFPLFNFSNRLVIKNDGSPAFTQTAKTKEQLFGDADNTPLSFDHSFNKELVLNAFAFNHTLEQENKNAPAVVKKSAKKRRLNFEIEFNPTVSYRKLTSNKPMQNTATNGTVSFVGYDINSHVTQKPDMGLELGFFGKYAVSKNVRLISGLQFNISHYQIKAFDHYPEMTTIALNRNYRPYSLTAISTYRNMNDAGNSWLQNFYFQVSVPMGVEVLLAGNNKTQVGIAGTVQPTYILGDRAYVLSSDLKHYAEVPSLVRHWNVNTSLQPFVSYSTGQLRWQVGPQVRYQLLSSFVSQYPVKENLFDFGLKVGVSLNNNQ